MRPGQTRGLIEHLAAIYPGLLHAPQVEALRQVMVQNYYWDASGRLRWGDDEGDSGLPPSALRIVSPYDPAARYARRGQVTRWTGYLAHVTETCADDGPNVITDVATMPATSPDTLALAGIRARPYHWGLLPAEHLVDGTSIALPSTADPVAAVRRHLHWGARPRAGCGGPGAAGFTCRPSRLRAVHDVGDRSDEEPHPAHALTLDLAWSGVTAVVVKWVAPIRDLLGAVGPGGDTQVALHRVLPGYGH
jgi:hypothetical protein